MGVFNTLLGNATHIDNNKAQERLQDILFDGENVEFAFSYIRDVILFTNSRIIFIDKQGVTGKKECFESIPYKSIIRFSVELTGNFDADSELKLWVSGLDDPIFRTFTGDKNIVDMQRLLAEKVCRK